MLGLTDPRLQEAMKDFQCQLKERSEAKGAALRARLAGEAR